MTIAYHTAMDIPRNIIEHTKKWLRSLKTHHRSVTLTRWGEKSDLINGNFETKAREFRKRMYLKLHTPLHIELRHGSQHNPLNGKEDTNHAIEQQPWRSWNEKKERFNCSGSENRYTSNVNDRLHSESSPTPIRCSAAKYKNTRSSLHPPSSIKHTPPLPLERRLVLAQVLRNTS